MHSSINTIEKIILALDKSNLADIQTLVNELSDYVGCFKVGLEAMTALGAPILVETIHNAGGTVFLDGKFCDIPNTVGQASKAASSLGVKLFNVHASCGMDAVKAAADQKQKSKLLVVTVLTSMDQATVDDVFHRPIPELVLKFAQQAREAGADGVVCSPKELALLNTDPSLKDFEKVTPGVRPTWASVTDQKRVMTPAEAIKAGATSLVIGRPITNPPAEIGDSIAAAKKIIEELDGVYA